MGVTDAGKYEIEPEIVFTPDKKSNYAITYTNNILEIAPMEITFDLGGDKGGETITYFGGRCMPDDPTMIVDGEKVTGIIFTGIYEDGQHVGRKITYSLPGNYQVQLTYGSYIDAGTYTIKPEVNFPEGGSDNYKLLYTNETMEILKREIIIRTGSKQKVYDGEELTNNDMVPVIENLVAGESATAEIKPARIKNAGSVTNTYQNLKWITAEEKNYTVNEELGTLTVVPVSLVLKSNCAFRYSSSITVDSWNLTVQVNNVENPARYQVNAQGDKTWQIVFYWDSVTDRIDAAIELTETATEFVFHPTYSITSGSAVNYNIITDDQSGTFDEAPYIDPDGNNSSDGTAGKLSLFAARGDDSTAVTSQANGTAEEDRKGITDTDTLPEQPAGEMKDQGTAAETDSADSGPESEEMNNKAETPNGEHAGTDNANNKTETPNAGDAQTENANKTTEISTSGVSETAVTDSGEKESSEIKEPSAIGNTIAEMKKQSETIIIAATENMMPIPQSTEPGADTLEEQTEGDS